MTQPQSHASDGTDPMLFTEKRSNTRMLGVAFAFSVAGGITLLVYCYQQKQWWPMAPVALLIFLWGMMIGGNLMGRRRLSPILRLDERSVYFIGGPLYAPRLEEIALSSISRIERESSVGVRVVLNDSARGTVSKPTRRTIPSGLLPLKDRKRFNAALKARIASST
ncbi:hypothetical protein [Larsenimonas salina]|uniref:hypothetical protein n=1 Tax=Larsenimonas salina TaxID=1295565 RepID=UPI0020739197|nr:hypothetical protein [Larsenimonas salina]MCM5703962.1 hypothetical protein [Larsenimonas salina]